MPRKARDIHAALTSKGFSVRESKDKMYHLFVDGKKTLIYTKMSQGANEVHDGLLSAMKKQLCLSLKQFNNLIDCPLSYSDYVDILKKAGKVTE